MLSTKHNFLFIHVPKTGGNSIQNVLAEYSDDKIVCLSPNQDGLERFEVRSSTFKTHKHSTLSDYRREYGDEIFEPLFKFCCVRNPWERVVSHYFSPHRGSVSWSKKKFLQFIHSSEIQPLGFFLATENNDFSNGIEKISYVIRYESIQPDFDVVCNFLGLPHSVLPHRNKSTRDEYRKYYDAESMSAVSDKFQAEIGRFGYSFD